MTTNVLIGVGGTGAKVVEAALHLFFAGLGPSKVIVGLVDQDGANGNVARTKALVNDLVRFRSDWSTGKNKLDWRTAEEQGGCVLGAVEVERLFGEECHWRPEQAAGATLATVVGRDHMQAGQRDLFDMLYAPGLSEQDMPLTQGYQGRAHIGAAAMLASLDADKDGFDKRLTELIGMAKQDQDVRIFLAGSVFGGTGAAGFPTLARAINQSLSSGAGGSIRSQNVRVAGALLLPYFGFSDPIDPDANVVRAGELMPQARAALEYYHRLFETERVFERLYVAGWDQFFQLGYHEPGKQEQMNPALPPELLAATAILDFFGAPQVPPPESADLRTAALERPRVLVSARADERELNWSDLTFDTDEARGQAYRRVGQLLRYATYWRLRVESELDMRGWTGKPKAVWLRDFAEHIDFKEETPQDRTRLEAMLQLTLKWAASMRLFASEKLNFDLWNTTALTQRADKAAPTDPVALYPTMTTKDLSNAYDALVDVTGRPTAWRGAAMLFEEISQPKPKQPQDSNAGLGRLVAAVHHAARPN